jgi:phosphate transport system substrate-binding protein
MKKLLGLGLGALLGLVLGVVHPSLAFAERLVLQGSTTVFPITVATAEAFMRENPGTDLSVRGGGSGTGIRALVEGGRIIAHSSRPMRHSEKMAMRAAGRNPVEHIIALDGMAIIVHPTNPVKNLTMEQVRDIYAGKITDWREVGGAPGRIVVVSRDIGSGTFGSFVDIVMDGKAIHPGSLFQASSGAVVEAVAGSPAAIGYVGVGFLDARTRAIKVDGIYPEIESVITGEYPISRPLFFYTDGEPRGLAKRYIDFVLSPAGQRIIKEQGFFPVR